MHPLCEDNVMTVVWFLQHAEVMACTKGYDPLMGLISMMVSLTLTHIHRHWPWSITPWPIDHGARCLFVDSLKTSIITVRVEEESGCLCVWECDGSIMGAEWYVVCQYLALIKFKRWHGWSCVHALLYLSNLSFRPWGHFWKRQDCWRVNIFD